MFEKFALALESLERTIDDECQYEPARRFVHSSRGMALAPFIVAQALSGSTARYSLYYRCHAWFLALGAEHDDIVRAVTDPTAVSPMQPRLTGVGVKFISVTVGAQLPVALGLALGSTDPTVAVLGDGALSTGVVFETLNAAAIHRPDLLFVLDDNNRAISTARRDVSRADPGTLARSFGINYHRVTSADDAEIEESIAWIDKTAGRVRLLHVHSEATEAHCLAFARRPD